LAGKVLVTGGAGFIGSHLVERLIARGDSPVIIDNLSTGSAGNLKQIDPGRFTLIKGQLSQVLKETPGVLDGVDRVFHLAATVGVQLVVSDPATMVKNNIDETFTLLDALAGRGVTVLVASSSEVYGKAVKYPLNEEDDLVVGPTTAPRWSYALTKALDEHLALAHHARGKCKSVVVRLFNTVGPRQVGHYGMVVPRFVEKAIKGEDLEVYGTGEQTRAFCDVRDVVRALEGLMHAPLAAGKVFNVGNDKEITINTLAKKVIEVVGSKSKIKRLSYEQAYSSNFEDPQRRVPDVGKVKREIGFEAVIPLEKTVADVAIALSSGEVGRK
jgi:UDP-glucose 4-epimerase